MKLFFRGHDERYAVEQTLLTLFPAERPTYPETEPEGLDGELKLTLQQDEAAFVAEAQLRYVGKTATAAERVDIPAGETDAVALTRLRRRSLQRAFYHAAVELLGHEPPWGLLSGVRPVKLPVRAVLSGATMDEAAAILRRDYRVTEPRIALAMDCAAAAISVKQSLAPGDICLYIGIPFCPSRCAYCSFVSTAGGNRKLIPPYLDALFAEMEAAGQRVRELGLRISSVYIGGGTPTTLEAEALSALLAHLHQCFDLPEGIELTVEAGRPDSITPEKLQAIRKGGANRVSLNPQSMSDEVLQAIGRHHTAQDIRDAWPLVQAEGFDAVNMDLIAGLPRDTLQSFQESLAEVIAFSPENITVHTLALKKGAALRQSDALPGAETLAEMLDGAWNALRTAGYRPYYLYRQKYTAGSFENVGWTKPGLHSIYNIGMMEELCGTLALGAGGVTKAVDYEKGSLSRLANPKYPQDYLRSHNELLARKRKFTL